MAGEAKFGVSPDAFTAFWTDYWGRLASSGAGAAIPQPPPDVMAQMRKTFFDAMSEHMDGVMRSEAFLNAMKQSMDHALAWQQMLNQTLQKGLSGAQMPSRDSADHVVMLVRGMEERVLGRLEDLAKRIEKLEKPPGGKK